MKNIAACYSDQAVKVADSYCSAHPTNRSYVSPKPSTSTSTSTSSGTIHHRHQFQTPPQNAVACTYKTKLISSKRLHITLTWSPKLLRRGFWIQFTDRSSPPSPLISNPAGTRRPSHKFAAPAGSERFSACGSEIQVHWDLSAARFEGLSPVPVGSFYVAVVVDSQLSLLLGDVGEDRRPLLLGSSNSMLLGLPVAKWAQVSQCEHLHGTCRFSTRARFCDSGPVHDLVIRCDDEEDQEEGGDPVLSVEIDGKSVVVVKRLRWNFRGNQVVFVDGLLVDLMWDVKRLISEDKKKQQQQEEGRLWSGGFDGVFMFRTRSGLDSRLWFEEDRLADQNHDKVEFSFSICAYKILPPVS